MNQKGRDKEKLLEKKRKNGRNGNSSTKFCTLEIAARCPTGYSQPLLSSVKWMRGLERRCRTHFRRNQSGDPGEAISCSTQGRKRNLSPRGNNSSSSRIFVAFNHFSSSRRWSKREIDTVKRDRGEESLSSIRIKCYRTRKFRWKSSIVLLSSMPLCTIPSKGTVLIFAPY